MSLRGTALLGCRYMAIHPIMPFMYEVDDAQRPLYYEMNRAFFAELIREAERCGVVICFENLPFKGLPTSSPTATAAFVREMASPFFQMCLDTGHSMILGEAPGEALRRNADVIRMLHVHDNDRLHDQHRLPYDGVIDWTDFRDALSAVDESVVLSLNAMSRRGCLHRCGTAAAASCAGWRGGWQGGEGRKTVRVLCPSSKTTIARQSAAFRRLTGVFAPFQAIAFPSRSTRNVSKSWMPAV